MEREREGKARPSRTKYITKKPKSKLLSFCFLLVPKKRLELLLPYGN